LADFERYKAAALRAARIDNKKGHPLFAGMTQFPPKL
jgi:hypothetical protein